jgi:hypothetical protein
MLEDDLSISNEVMSLGYTKLEDKVNKCIKDEEIDLSEVSLSKVKTD